MEQDQKVSKSLVDMKTPFVRKYIYKEPHRTVFVKAAVFPKQRTILYGAAIHHCGDSKNKGCKGPEHKTHFKTAMDRLVVRPMQVFFDETLTVDALRDRLRSWIAKYGVRGQTRDKNIFEGLAGDAIDRLIPKRGLNKKTDESPLVAELRLEIEQLRYELDVFRNGVMLVN